MNFNTGASEQRKKTAFVSKVELKLDLEMQLQFTESREREKKTARQKNRYIRGWKTQMHYNFIISSNSLLIRLHFVLLLQFNMIFIVALLPRFAFLPFARSEEWEIRFWCETQPQDAHRTHFTSTSRALFTCSLFVGLC